MPGEAEPPDPRSSPPPFAILDPPNSKIADSFPSPRLQEKSAPDSASPTVAESSVSQPRAPAPAIASTWVQPVQTTLATNRGRRSTSSSLQQAPRHKSSPSSGTIRSSTWFQDDFGIGIDLPTRPRPSSLRNGTARSAISSPAGKERRSSGAKYASTLSRLTRSGEWTIGTCDLGTTTKEYKVDLSMATLRQGCDGFASSALEESTADGQGRTVNDLSNPLISTSSPHQLRPSSKNTDNADLPSITLTARRHRRYLKWVFIVIGIIVAVALLSTALVCGLLRRPRAVVVGAQIDSTRLA
ncbi:BZ3500_MvSof-1268-A1-R1_Chr12-3g04053 [Microbotryum saponariae]|uniref:BZ3500_MvSof-1268-A1-R1_Chr12-3g04053 protein n=1 Tax=Microbotryum saponariae TaxID=289078 RepID=A0A2X0KR96_9BASI|nr:BZ3500_MvSof-1268-A1-R1_Chr12-3g04053 [Microbotryum saponariae]SDA02609.1 BZ3501_MvSof-1269-A2-R1_Chr12-3g03708 [Microbotryum saponariae]